MFGSFYLKQKKVSHEVEDFTLRHLDSMSLVKSLKDCCQSPEKQLCSEEFSTTPVTYLTSQMGLLSLLDLVKKTETMASLRIAIIWSTITIFTKYFKQFCDAGAETQETKHRHKMEVTGH